LLAAWASLIHYASCADLQSPFDSACARSSAKGSAVCEAVGLALSVAAAVGVPVADRVSVAVPVCEPVDAKLGLCVRLGDCVTLRVPVLDRVAEALVVGACGWRAKTEDDGAGLGEPEGLRVVDCVTLGVKAWLGETVELRVAPCDPVAVADWCSSLRRTRHLRRGHRQRGRLRATARLRRRR